jgi:hypothetical protein
VDEHEGSVKAVQREMELVMSKLKSTDTIANSGKLNAGE